MSSKQKQGNKGSKGQQNQNNLADKNKSLQTENENLKLELKQLKDSLETTETDFNKSVRVRERLDCLAKALENRTQEIKAENRAHILAAEDQSQNLAHEVSSNMGVMKNIHANLGQVTTESSKVRGENDDLLKKVDELKVVYGDREKAIQAELEETHNAFIKAQTDFAHLKLKTAEDKEKLFGEMQRIASQLVESKQEMKDAKETELGLRTLLQKYDDKFKGLNEALMETNKGYDSFKDEMEGMVKRTKDLEQEALKWQKRWEESNTTLLGMSKDHEKLQNELQVVHDKLVKMTGLCRTLQQEIAALEDEKKKAQVAPAEAAPAPVQNANLPNVPAEPKPASAPPAPTSNAKAGSAEAKPAGAPAPLPANPTGSPAAKPTQAPPAQNTKGGKGKNKQQNQKQPEKPKTPEPPKVSEKPTEEPKPVVVKAPEVAPPKEEPKPKEAQPAKPVEVAPIESAPVPAALPANAQVQTPAAPAAEAVKAPEVPQAAPEPKAAVTPDTNQASSQQKKKKHKRGKH